MKLKLLGVPLFFAVGCAGAPEAASSAPGEAAPGSTASATATAPTEARSTERESVSRALELYAAEDYARAADAFEQAYAEKPDASLLFARAQSLRLAGRCAEARVLYDQFLVATTDPTHRNAVEQLVNDCEAPLDAPAGEDQVAAR